MPLYNASPFAVVPVKLIPGRPAYLLGSFKDTVAPTRLLVTSCTSSTTIGTYGVTITEGNVPAVGSLLTVQGATTNTQFNQTNVAIASVTAVNAAIGTYTLTTSGSYSTVSVSVDTGVGLVPQPEVGDTLVNNSFSIPCGLPYTTPNTSDSPAQQLQLEVNFPTLPTGVTVAFQVAMTNTPATQWQTAVANVVTVATGTATYGTTQWSGKALFGRYAITGLSGSGSIVGKVVV